MAKKPRNVFLDTLVYLTLRGFVMLAHCWPINANLRMARILGTVWYHLDRPHRQRAMANLRNSYPELSEAKLHYMARKSFQHILMLGTEVLFSTSLIHVHTWRKYIELDNFEKTLELLISRKRGVIMLTGHYGNWEVLGYVLATLGFETTTVARPLDNPLVNRWIFGVRIRKGQKIINKKGATSDIIQTLEDHGAVGFVADQNAGSKGLFVDFFGRKASTYKSIGLLAMQYEVPIVVGYARRLHNQFRFRMAMQDIIWPEDWKDQADPLRYITQRYTRAIETFVREDPLQYLWIHRRWKSRPKNEKAQQFD